MCSLQLFNWRKDLNMDIWVNKFGHILSSGLFSDVKFSVGSSKEVIEGHRLFLMAGSRVFQELLEDKKDEKIIQIPTVEPKEFKLILKYLYTGDKGYKNEVNFDPLAFFKALKYFEIEELYEESIQDLIIKISVQNALKIYEESKNYLKIDQLTEASEIFIMENADKIIKEPSFLTIDPENLEYFLASDNFKADEAQLSLAVLEWGKVKCLEQNFETTDEILQEILEEFIPLIRFPTMSPRNFTIVTKYYVKILKPDELIRIYQYFHLQQESAGIRRQSIEELGFITRPRNKKITPISTQTSLTTNKIKIGDGRFMKSK